MILKLFLILFVFFLPAVSVRADEKPSNCYDAGFTTIIKDEVEAKLLFDPHLFQDQRDDLVKRGQHVFMDSYTLNNDDYKDSSPGYAIIKNGGNICDTYIKNLYTVMGWHSTYSSFYGIRSFIQISGVITEIRPFEFDLEGDIAASYDNTLPQVKTFNFMKGQYFLRGKFTFSRKNHPDYWSLTNTEKFGNANDYIGNLDIYVSPDLSE